MPYDFDLESYYDFDFSSFLRIIQQNKVFDSCSNYFEIWNHVFNKLTIIQEDEKNKTIYNKQNYQYCLDFNSPKSQFKLHFHIPYMLEIIQKNPIQFSPQCLELSLFGTENSSIQYTKMPYEKYHYHSKEPILLVPLRQNNFIQYIVIDGNHRITAKIASKQKTILAIVYIPLKRLDFLSSLDWAFYLFIIDLHYLHDELLRGTPFNELLSRLNLFTTFQCLI